MGEERVVEKGKEGMEGGKENGRKGERKKKRRSNGEGRKK